jgi:hypothetical protein
MRSIRRQSVALAVVGLLAPALAAQAHRMPGKEGARERFAGTVVGIDTMKMEGKKMPAHDEHHMMEHRAMTQGGGGLALRVARERDTVAVHLGPLWYLAEQNPTGFASGDRVEVDAAPVAMPEHPHWMAYSITKDGREFSLRAADGTPRWMAAMHGRMATPHEGCSTSTPCPARPPE